MITSREKLNTDIINEFKYQLTALIYYGYISFLNSHSIPLDYVFFNQRINATILPAARYGISAKESLRLRLFIFRIITVQITASKRPTIMAINPLSNPSRKAHAAISLMSAPP